MKRFNGLLTILFAGLFLFTAASVMAQRGQGFKGQSMGRSGGPGFHRQCQMIPDLNDDQQEQIKDLRTDQMKEMTQFRNRLTEKRASLRTFQTQEDPDMAAINNTIEEMGEIRTEMQKARAEHHQEIREILTEEQRAFFDARMKRSRGNFMQQRMGNMRGNRGMCPMGDMRPMGGMRMRSFD